MTRRWSRLAGVKLLAVRRADARDNMRLHADAAIGEGRIGRDHLKRRDLRRAQRQRGVGLQFRGYAEPVRRAHDRLGADLHADAHGDRVERERQRLGQRHRAEIFAAVVSGCQPLTLIGPSSRTVSGVRHAPARSDRRTA